MDRQGKKEMREMLKDPYNYGHPGDELIRAMKAFDIMTRFVERNKVKKENKGT